MSIRLIRKDINDDWIVKAVSDENDIPANIRGKNISASVPGCIHVDLLNASLIPDPYVDNNECEVQWISMLDWEYSTKFSVSDEMFSAERIELVFEGLDTVTEVFLNGNAIGQTYNMHHPYRFDCRKCLLRDENDLRILFKSPVKYARQMRDKFGELPRAVWAEPYNFIRKMACNFGWDWGPILTTSGIWKPIRLESWSLGRIESARPLVTHADNEYAHVEVYVDMKLPDNSEMLAVSATLSDFNDEVKAVKTKSVSSSHICVSLTVEKPSLWWPRGYGEQPLYNLNVQLIDIATGNEIDYVERRIGLRTVNLDTSNDEIGSRFTFEINGQTVFCKGANWIPADCFITRVDETKYKKDISLACDANMNMLRVWGGGIYENELFYDICDELGIMVWQDFLLVCALYPEEGPYKNQIEAEARYNVARLSSHPSLVLWNGGNESVWQYMEASLEGKTYKQWAEGRTWGAGYYFEMLPKIVKDLDPTRPYWANSPYSGTVALSPGKPEYGCTHIWSYDVREDYMTYNDYAPRFASEFGVQSCCCHSTLMHGVSADCDEISEAYFASRQKSPDGNVSLDIFLEKYFKHIFSIDDWVYLTQLHQARAMRFAIESFRSLQPHCMGTLYWQLNDCWPAISWAAVDSFDRKKLLWYATRKFYGERLITVRPDSEGCLSVYAINDCNKAWYDVLTVERYDFSGLALKGTEMDFEVRPWTSKLLMKIPSDIAVPSKPTSEMLLARAGLKSAEWYFLPDCKLDYPFPDFEISINQAENRVFMQVTARTFLRDLTILADIITPDAVVNDQLFTLMPGETVEFVIENIDSISYEQLFSKSVLKCSNWYGRIQHNPEILQKTINLAIV